MKLSGAVTGSVKSFGNHGDWNFVENKGQLINPPTPFSKGDSASNNSVRYYGHSGGVNLYCKPQTISFVFTKVEKEANQISEATSRPSGFPLPKGVGGFGRKNNQQDKISTNRADLILLNSNSFAQIIASDQQEYYENFYTENTPEEGITHVHTYKTITYKSIYPNIDFVLHAKEGGLEYEFVVYPGGKVSDIQIQWEGLKGIKKLENLGIEYSLFPLEKGSGGFFGKLTESAPYSYQGIAGNVGAGLAPAQSEKMDNELGNENYDALGGGKPRPYKENIPAIIPSRFILKNNRIGFATGIYDKSKPLIIDPFLSWGTYFGGIDFESGNAVAADKSGNAYITGYAESQSGIVTSGAFQTAFGGDVEDAYLAKFSKSGQLLWATYYGGDGNDYGNGVATDGSLNVYITGTTASTNGIASSGAFQTSKKGATNAFLAKFNTAGVRQWGTYYGGAKNDYGTGLATDGSGNVYMEGETNSLSGLGTNGAYQVYLVGNNDAFLAKFNSSGALQWGTYYGGNNFTYSTTPALDNSGNIYITGYTTCTSGIATNGAYQTSFADVTDAFLAKFNSKGGILWATY